MNFTNDICDVCGITNKAELSKEFFSEEEISTFIENVFNNTISVVNLDVVQYSKMSRKMSESIVKGFGSELYDISYGTEEYLLLQDLIESAYIFNAAKQYQCVREISDLINENFATKKEYYDKAIEIFKKYNYIYFEVELDSAEYQAKSAREWIEFVKWNNEDNG